MLTISDLYDLHNLCIDAIYFWTTAPVASQEMKDRH